MIRILRTVAVLAVVAVIAVAGFMRVVGDDPAVWHVDPATAKRHTSSNDYMVAPEGATTGKPDRIAKVYGASPRDLLFQFDAVARPAGAVAIAGSVDDLWITYVQRTAIMGYPDYVSVKAIAVDGGSSLIVWSRSRFGYRDWGTNRARVEGWLAKLGG